MDMAAAPLGTDYDTTSKDQVIHPQHNSPHERLAASVSFCVRIVPSTVHIRHIELPYYLVRWASLMAVMVMESKMMMSLTSSTSQSFVVMIVFVDFLLCAIQTLADS